MGQRVLVCGGHHYDKRDLLYAVLDFVHLTTRPVDCVIHGDATGADSLAKAWAELHNVPLEPYPAAWDDLSALPLILRYRPNGTPYNAAAGFIRNQRMLVEGRPNLALAFAGGKGTADMVERVERANRYSANILLAKFP